MKIKYFLLITFAVGMLIFNSCIREEALNAECDITRVVLSVPSPANFFYQLSDSIKNVSSSDSVITYQVRDSADITALAPCFDLTEGATIEPANGSIHDFSLGPVNYTVTSADHNWSRHYKMEVLSTQVQPIDTNQVIRHYDFEEYELEPTAQKYYYWKQDGADGFWATGNPGFKLSRSTAKPDEYPTVPADNGVSGHCIKLTTCSTGGLGELVNMRLAAGNFYIGNFDATTALSNTLQATSFGLPFTLCPVVFKGYYQYTPGKDYQNRNGTILSDSVDKPDIYAVYYENTDAQGNAVMLHGDDVLSSPHIVAIARMSSFKTTNKWTSFSIPFKYLQQVDVNRLQNRGYNMSIVCSSSRDGASFCGAIGSTLLIDAFTLICNKDE